MREPCSSLRSRLHSWLAVALVLTIAWAILAYFIALEASGSMLLLGEAVSSVALLIPAALSGLKAARLHRRYKVCERKRRLRIRRV